MGERPGKSKRYLKVKNIGRRIIVLGKKAGARGKPSLHLNHNYDFHEMKGSIFEPTVKEGKIFGKGADNPKAGIASIIMAVEAVKRAKVSLNGDLFVSFTPDLGLGGESGAGYLVEKEYGKSDMAITGAPGGPETVTLGHKGALWMEITTLGKQAHAGEDTQGINAVDKMIEIQRALYELDQKYVKDKKRISNWPVWPADCSRPTITTAAINAKGLGVPEKCVMNVDRRINPEETIRTATKEILDTIRKVKKKDKHLKYDFQILHAVESAVTSPNSRLAKTMMNNIRETLDVKPKTVVFCYYSDFRFFRTKWKSQTIGYDPGIPQIYRRPGEYIPI